MATEGTAFGAALRRLRLAAGFTQERLAERAGLSAKAIIGLENESARTPRLDTITRLADALGADRDDRARLLAAARPASAPPVAAGPRADGEPVPIHRPAILPHAPGGPAETAPTDRPTVVPMAPRGRDWGEAPDVGALHGRSLELATLSRWVGADGCRLVAVVGMGGIGKTALAARLAHEQAPRFDAVYWRSLRNAPPCSDWLAGAVLSLSDQHVIPSEGEEPRLRQVLELLQERRTLLILDNLETVLEPGAPALHYREGYDGYGQVLQWLGETGHRSCMVATSREVPPEVGPHAGAQAPVRALRLGGIDVKAGRELLAGRGLIGDAATWEALVTRYGGNALALQVVADTIAAIFGGEISTFLAQAGAVYGDIRRLLEAQLARLSAEERTVIDWLAVEREPVDVGALVADLGPAVPRGAALEALDALRRRSLLERGEQGATFTLQPVVLEHATDRLVEQLADEGARGQPARLVSHAMIKAHSRDYVRQSQERMLGEPVLQLLTSRHGEAGAAERLLALLDGWRGRSVAEQGYGPGNAVNLLRLLRGHLRGLDLSRLAIRQAYLADMEAQDASLVNARVAETIFAEAFDFPGSVALSGDGALLAAGTSTGEVRLWRVADRTPLWAARGHTGALWCMALSRDGGLLASGAEDGSLGLWEMPNGRLLATLQRPAGGVWGVALSSDGGLLASGGADGTVELWEAPSGRLLTKLQGQSEGIWTVALSGDARLLAAGGPDGKVRLWEMPSGRLLATLQGHSGGVRAVALSEDGRLVASGSFDRTVKLWEAPSERLLATLQGHTGVVRTVALSRDGGFVASGDQEGMVRLWEAPSGRLLATLQGHTGAVEGVALSDDAGLLASGGQEGMVRLWEAPSGRLLATLQGHTAVVRAVALSRDGGLAASGGQDGAVRLWEAPSGRLLATLPGHTGGALGVVLSEDGQLVVSGGYDGTIKLWDVASGRLRAALPGHTGVVISVASSADGALLASGGIDGAVRLWDAPSGRLLTALQGHAGGVWGVTLSADGALLASGGIDGTVRLWQAGTGRPLATLEGHTGVVLSVALSADGALLASGGTDGAVRLWDAPSGRLLTALQGHTGVVQGVALSADGVLLASGGTDGAVRLWDAPSGRLLATLQGHTGGVRDVALSADGRLVASGGYDGTVRLWEAGSGTSLRMLRAERRYERLDITGLTGITAAQRGALLALGAVDRSVPTSEA